MTTITPADINAACRTIADNPAMYRSTRPLPTTAKRHDARLLADGRDALVRVLIANTPGLKQSNITAAIRAGHAGSATDFAAINAQGARALGFTLPL